MTPRKALWSMLLLNFLAIAVALAIGLSRGHPADQFGESKFITKFSALQLLTVGWLAFSIFKARRDPVGSSLWRSNAFLWALIACGFVFLAIDELLKLHERTDKAIHFLFNLRETALTDRIDDAIIGLYGLIGLGVLWYYRAEFKLFRPAIPYFVGGFILLFAMVAVDLFANAKDIIPALVEKQQVKIVMSWLTALEESLKILGEAVFVLAFYRVFRQVKPLAYKDA